jgi:hypothetical protein
MMTTLSHPTDRSETLFSGYASAAQWKVPFGVSRRILWLARKSRALAVSLGVERAERFAALERQLERRALDVLDEDLRVVRIRIDARLLDRRADEVLRLAREVLIERRSIPDRTRHQTPAFRTCRC